MMATAWYRELRTILLKLFCIYLLAGISSSLSAQTIELQAITDFPDLTAGEVPYYIDTVGDRNVLAINAANVDYREKYARATTTFNGASGNYNVTITALGEIDGEGEFRFLVNGVLVGSAFNQRVSVDWGEQLHSFDDIQLMAGDEIAVESSALSNELIPENGEYAFARGRWRSLNLNLDDNTTAIPETADLRVEAISMPTDLPPDHSQSVSFALANLSETVTATNINILLYATDNVSAELVDAASLAQLAPDSTTTILVDVTALTPGDATLTVNASADQSDPFNANNSATSSLTVSMITTTSNTVNTDPAELTDNSATSPQTTAAAQAEPDNPFLPTAEGLTDTAADSSSGGDGDGGGGGSISVFTAMVLLVLVFAAALSSPNNSRRRKLCSVKQPKFMLNLVF